MFANNAITQFHYSTTLLIREVNSWTVFIIHCVVTKLACKLKQLHSWILVCKSGMWNSRVSSKVVPLRWITQQKAMKMTWYISQEWDYMHNMSEHNVVMIQLFQHKSNEKIQCWNSQLKIHCYFVIFVQYRFNKSCNVVLICSMYCDNNTR